MRRTLTRDSPSAERVSESLPKPFLLAASRKRNYDVVQKWETGCTKRTFEQVENILLNQGYAIGAQLVRERDCLGNVPRQCRRPVTGTEFVYRHSG